MERNEISIHEVRLYRALLDHTGQWMSAKELAEMASIAPRTARAHSSKLVDLGLVDCAEVFPAHRYRWSDKADKRNGSYLLRLQRAAEVFSSVM